jgi:hypothetical protein
MYSSAVLEYSAVLTVQSVLLLKPPSFSWLQKNDDGTRRVLDRSGSILLDAVVLNFFFSDDTSQFKLFFISVCLTERP